MSATSYREWECDRCGKTERRTTLEFQPSGWAGIESFVPPLSSERHPVFGRKHFCGPCHRALVEFCQRLPETAETVLAEAVTR